MDKRKGLRVIIRSFREDVRKVLPGSKGLLKSLKGIGIVRLVARGFPCLGYVVDIVT